jgi:hypothetical protein
MTLERHVSHRTCRSFAREVTTRALEFTLTVGAVLPAHMQILRPRSYHTGSGIHTYRWSGVTRAQADPSPAKLSHGLWNTHLLLEWCGSERYLTCVRQP